MPKRRSSTPSHSRSSHGPPTFRRRRHVPRAFPSSQATFRRCGFYRAQCGGALGGHGMSKRPKNFRRDENGQGQVIMLPVSKTTYTYGRALFRGVSSVFPQWMCQDHRNTRERKGALRCRLFGESRHVSADRGYPEVMSKKT